MNIQLIGKVTGIITDTETGEQHVAFEETNHIQDAFITAASSGFAGGKLGTDIVICYGAETKGQRRDWAEMPDNARAGVAIAGVTSPQYTYYDQVDNVHVKQLAKRFDAPAETQVIWAIGIQALDWANYQPQALVSLTVPCTLTPTQTLDVFYRIQMPYDENYWDTEWPADSVVPSPDDLYEWAKYIFSGSQIPVQQTYHPTNWADKTNPRRLKSGIFKSGSLTFALPSGSSNKDYFKASFKRGVTITSEAGKLVGLSAYGNSYGVNGIHWHKVLEGLDVSPIQNVFGHAANAVVPFYDAGTAQAGLGTFTIDGSSWTNPDYPKQLKLNIKTSGGLGVSDYNIQMRNSFGFTLNTYSNDPAEIIGFHPYNSHMLQGFQLHRGTNDLISSSYETKKHAAMKKYNSQKFMAAWVDDFCLVDVLTNTGVRFNAASTPSMSATNICQFDKDETTGDMYIACRDNGVYRITADLLGSTRIYSATTGLTGVTGCHGVAVTAAGRVWAYFNGGAGVFGLYYSDNSGTSWTKSNYTFPAVDANPDEVFGIYCDPSHADDQLAVCYVGPRGTPIADAREMYISWYDLANTVAVGGTAIQGPLLHIVAQYDVPNTYNQGANSWADYTIPLTYSTALTCSPNNGYWLTPFYKTAYSTTQAAPAAFEFGTLTVNVSAFTDLFSGGSQNGGWGVDENLNDAYFYATEEYHDNNEGWVVNQGIAAFVKPADMSIEYNLPQNYRPTWMSIGASPSIYLGDGVLVGLRTPAFAGGVYPQENDDAGGAWIVSMNPYSETRTGGAGTSGVGTMAVWDNECNPVYGWNGVSWEKYHAGLKATHAANETLIDGLAISFDDAAGNFVADDYYTTFIFDGIVTDNSTTFEQELWRYMKPAEKDTTFEASVLPGTTRIPPHHAQSNPSSLSDWRDTVDVSANVVAGGGTIYAVGAGTYGSWVSAGRSITPAIVAETSNLSSVKRLPQNDLTGVHGYIEFRPINNSTSTIGTNIAAGLSDVTKLGTPIDRNTINYCLIFDAPPSSGGDFMSVSAVESGVTKATIPNITISGGVADHVKARILIMTDGRVIYEMFTGNNGWTHIHESPPGTATIEDLYFDINFGAVQNSNGLMNINYFSHLDTADHYLFMGNGVDTGLFHNRFRILDPDTFILTIGGLPAVNIGVNDKDTTLNAGEYSVFPEAGCIRYSASDVGKTIAGEYIYIRDES